jgi:quercetin dioxygenase-like cupin family protein
MNEVSRHVVYTHEKDVAAIPLPGRSVRPLAGRENGAQLLSAGIVTFPAHSVSAAHVHDSEEEALYVVDGRGHIDCNGQALPIEPGSFLLIPPGISHSVHNTGDEPIKFFYAFSPPVVVGSW